MQHLYLRSLRAHVRRLEAQIRKAIREGKPSDHIAMELSRARAELEGA